jgi:hypothetical protein
MSELNEIESECGGVLAWAAGQNVAAGEVVELTLPPALAHVSQGGVVHVARTGDGRHCVLLKKSVGWKENFEGLLCCDGALRPSEVVEPRTGAAYISLPGLGIFEELYIRRRYSDLLFEVYFDLN